MSGYGYPFVGPSRNYIRKDHYPLSQSCNKKNGFMVTNTAEKTDERIPSNYQKLNLSKSLNEISLVDRYYANLGKVETESKKPFQPKFVELDKKVLKFFAYFVEPVYESLTEIHRIRSVYIYYYLLEDVISIVEPEISNSGLVQGKIFIRQKVPKSLDKSTYLFWTDINIGQNIDIFGRIYTITDCDLFTKTYYQNEGQRLNELEYQPTDPYLEKISSKCIATSKTQKLSSSKKITVREPLMFYAVWDDTKGDDYNRIWRRRFSITYFDTDETFLIRELSDKFDGLTPLMINRQKLRKEPEITFNSNSQFLSLDNLAIGKWLDVTGRPMFIFDCHKTTKTLLAISEEPIDLNQYPLGHLPARIIGKNSSSRLPNVLTFTACLINAPSYFLKSSNIIEYNVETKSVQIWENISTERPCKGRAFIGKSSTKLRIMDFKVGENVKLFRWMFHLENELLA